MSSKKRSELSELITPCPTRIPSTQPAPPESGPTIGLTFSGGGFRATLPALGVLRFVADAGLLGNLRYVSSVSGGSVANAVLAKNWPKIRDDGYRPSAVDEHVIDPILDKVGKKSLKLKLLLNAWRAVGSKNRTGVLADAFDDWWLDGIELERLDPEVRWIVNAANMNTGVRFGFERELVGDYVAGRVSTAGSGVRLATAASASAAVPGPFARVELPDRLAFPCAREPDSPNRPSLLDGGVYDNTGLEALDNAKYRDVFTISLNAGGVMKTGRATGSLPMVRDLQRANSILYRQSTALRTRWTVDRFEEFDRAQADGREAGRNARQGLLFALSTNIEAGGGDAYAEFTSRYPELRQFKDEDLAFVATSFDKFSPALCRALIYRGWWLAGASMSRYQPHMIDVGKLGTGPPRD